MSEPRSVVIPYSPRLHQQQVHSLIFRKLRTVVVAHRRFGKSVALINQLIMSALKCNLQRPRYAFIAPTFKQAKLVIWDYLKFYTGSINDTQQKIKGEKPYVTYNENELRCDLPNESRITLFGADNYDSIRGLYLDGVVMDEFAQIPKPAWTEVISPMLIDRQGFAVFSGTPKGQDYFYELYQQAVANPDRWGRAMFKASQTGIIPQAELDILKKEMDPATYAQEFECSFTGSIKGAYYNNLIDLALEEGRITKVPYNPAAPVLTAWDLGMSDSTSIWVVQKSPDKQMYHIIDYIEDSNKTLPQYLAMLKMRGYENIHGILPHDAMQRSISTGLTRVEVLMQHGLKVTPLAKLPIDDGINAVRQFLSKCLFDEAKCRKGISALRNYHAKEDIKKGMITRVPNHDWSSHGADAFRYLAVGADRVSLVEHPFLRVNDKIEWEEWGHLGGNF